MDSITKTVTMYYDKYKEEFGDGFYPLMNQNKNNTLTPIDITFICNNNFTRWSQISGINIKGLDSNTGDKLLSYLNNDYENLIDSKNHSIQSCYSLIIYPKPLKIKLHKINSLLNK
jgi:hypothetical protein